MKNILILSFLLIFSLKLNAQIFDSFDENIIKYQVGLLIDKYEQLTDFTEDGITFSEGYDKAFKNIFTDQKNRNIYNDLQPRGGYISPMEYAQIAKDYFPHGLETKTDSGSFKFLQAKLLNADEYSIELIADKYVVGVTKENKIHWEKITAHFIIHFKYNDENEEFYDFLIASITNEATLLKKKSDKQMQGFHIGVGLMPGIRRLSLSGNSENYKRDTGFPLSNSAGLNIFYFINSNFGVSTGLAYTVYNTRIISGYSNGQNNNLGRTDGDGDNYYLYVNSEINEQGKFVFLDIPLSFTYRHGLADKISFYASVGIITSLLQSSEFNVTGDASQSGYYPEYKLLIDDAELYNFGTVKYDDDYPVDISTVQFMASVSAGISLPIGTAGHFNVGLGYRQNITGLEYNTAAYRDDFISINGVPEKSCLQFLSLSISYTHKIFEFPKK